jgi:hypothetical protein
MKSCEKPWDERAGRPERVIAGASERVAIGRGVGLSQQAHCFLVQEPDAAYTHRIIFIDLPEKVRWSAPAVTVLIGPNPVPRHGENSSLEGVEAEMEQHVQFAPIDTSHIPVCERVDPGSGPMGVYTDDVYVPENSTYLNGS